MYGPTVPFSGIGPTRPVMFDLGRVGPVRPSVSHGHMDRLQELTFISLPFHVPVDRYLMILQTPQYHLAVLTPNSGIHLCCGHGLKSGN